MDDDVDEHVQNGIIPTVLVQSDTKICLMKTFSSIDSQLEWQHAKSAQDNGKWSWRLGGRGQKQPVATQWQ